MPHRRVSILCTRCLNTGTYILNYFFNSDCTERTRADYRVSFLRSNLIIVTELVFVISCTRKTPKVLPLLTQSPVYSFHRAHISSVQATRMTLFRRRKTRMAISISDNVLLSSSRWHGHRSSSFTSCYFFAQNDRNRRSTENFATHEKQGMKTHPRNCPCTTALALPDLGHTQLVR